MIGIGLRCASVFLLLLVGVPVGGDPGSCKGDGAWVVETVAEGRGGGIARTLVDCENATNGSDCERL